MPASSNKLRLTGLAVAGLALATTLAACGGSDDTDNTPPTPPVASNTPPASASASSSGFIAYLKTLVVTTPETSEPLDVASFVAPTDDTGAFDPTI